MTLRHCWDFPNQTIKSFNQNKICYTSELRNVSQHYFYLISLHFPSIIWLLCSILLKLLSLIVALWRPENCQTLLDLAYLLRLPFFQLSSMLNEPILLNLPTLASIAPYMAFPCFHEVCLHLLMLLDSANFNILTLIIIGLEYICNMVKAAQGNKIYDLITTTTSSESSERCL